MAAVANSTRVLVFARAPEPGAAKTRLIPLLGAERAANLQRILIERALRTAIDARLGDVELWCTPSAAHPLFSGRPTDLRTASQRGNDLGARMFNAASASLKSSRRAILVGTDCPALLPTDLQDAARALQSGYDAVFTPAEDGGYVLVGLARCDARLFDGISWGTDTVMACTRARLAELGWRWLELPVSWDVDRPADFHRLAASGLIAELDAALGMARA